MIWSNKFCGYKTALRQSVGAASSSVRGGTAQRILGSRPTASRHLGHPPFSGGTPNTAPQRPHLQQEVLLRALRRALRVGGAPLLGGAPPLLNQLRLLLGDLLLALADALREVHRCRGVRVGSGRRAGSRWHCCTQPPLAPHVWQRQIPGTHLWEERLQGALQAQAGPRQLPGCPRCQRRTAYGARPLALVTRPAAVALRRRGRQRIGS